MQNTYPVSTIPTTSPCIVTRMHRVRVGFEFEMRRYHPSAIARAATSAPLTAPCACLYRALLPWRWTRQLQRRSNSKTLTSLSASSGPRKISCQKVRCHSCRRIEPRARPVDGRQQWWLPTHVRCLLPAICLTLRTVSPLVSVFVGLHHLHFPQPLIGSTIHL
jgi:hypothetical protein